MDLGTDNKIIWSQRTVNTVTNKKNLLSVFRNKPIEGILEQREGVQS